MIKNVKLSCYGVINLILATAFICGCSTVKVPIPVTHPAEINMSSYKQVAIGEIGGNMGRDFAANLKNKLVEGGAFTVVDRQRLDQIMKELNLSQSDLTDENNRAKLGKMLSASVLIFGRLDGAYNEEITKSEGTCTDKNNKAYNCTEYFRNGSYKSNGSVDVVDVQTGQILRSKILNADFGATTRAIDKNPSSIDKGALAGRVIYADTAIVVKAIQPWKETVQVPFKKDGDIPALERGINQAQMGDLGECTKTFLEAIKSCETNPKISSKSMAAAYWDLALAYEYSFDFDRALDAIKKAYSLQAEDDYLKEKANIQRMKSEKAKLDEQVKK